MGTDQEGIFSCIIQSEPRIVVSSLPPFCVIPAPLKKSNEKFLKSETIPLNLCPGFFSL